tara:strand:- start:317 stop:1042 length:726 start_codon:yes stop_codon:yes gene_type:complete
MTQSVAGRSLARRIFATAQRPARGQILVASFPKSGSTWLRQVTFAILHGGLPDDMETFDKLAPEIGKNLNIWRAKIVKTHWAHTPAFDRAKRLFIVRHPEAVFRSYYDYQKQVVGREFNGFDDFFRSRWGLPEYAYNLECWRKDTGKHLVDYDDLLNDFDGSVNRIAAYIGVTLDAETLDKIRAATSRSSMQKRFDANGFKYDFANTGQSQRYVLSEKDKAMIEADAVPVFDRILAEAGPQ